MGAPRVRRVWASSSITLRLTLLFAGATFGILLLASGALYQSLGDSLRSEDARLLTENATLLQEALEQGEDRLTMLLEELAFEPSTRRLEPYYARVTDEDGELIIEAPGMAGVLPTSAFTTTGVGNPAASWRSPNGRDFLVLSLSTDTRPVRHIQVGLDVTHDSVILGRYRRQLLSVLIAATFLAALAGLVIARHGLRPITEITSAVGRMTARDLHQRIGGTYWPKELSGLARVFDDMLARLEESFGRMSRFSADIAHEIRTPVTNLRSGAEITLGRARTPEEYRDALASSLEEYDRLTEIVDRLLFLARAESGADALESRTVEVREEVEVVLDFYSVLAEEKGVELECVGAARATLDPALFRRALANLLSNALEHTHRGGHVSVRVADAGATLQVEVQDNGSGIPAEHLPHVTERFYRVDPARAGNGAGAGLGLSLVNTIVDLHGGSMELSSRPGAGTTVKLVFPPAP